MDFELDEETLMYGESERPEVGFAAEATCDNEDGNSSNDDTATCEDTLDRGTSPEFAPIPGEASRKRPGRPKNEALSGSMGSGRPGSFGRRTTAITMSHHMKVVQETVSSEPIGGVKMGSSAPISIPGWKIRSVGSGGGSTTITPEDLDAKPMAATFVPPHMMDPGGFDFGWDGASPAAALKKGKLRVRNQVLRSTGFLADNQEVQAAQISTMGGLVGPRISNGAPTLASGGLSAAMTAQQ